MLIVPGKRIWTQQPQGANGIAEDHPWKLVWSAVFPELNLVSGLKKSSFGSPFVGENGRWVDLNSTTSTQSHSVELPTNAYTVLLVYPYVRSNQPSSRTLLRTTGGGFRFEPYTTGGGAYTQTVHTSVAALSGISVSADFSSAYWVHVATYDGVVARQFIVDPKGLLTTLSDTVAMFPGTGTLDISSPSGSLGAYAIAYMPKSISVDKARSLAFNPWQIFRAPDSRIFVPTGAGAGGGDSLIASSIIASPASVGSPLLSQQHALSALSIATAPAVVASPVITQRNALSATVVSASSAVVGSPSITQRHALTATAISAAPAAVGPPALTEIIAGVLSALPIIAAPAVVGAPAITQKHALSAGAISAGPATFGTPTLAQQHALIAQGVTAGAAVVGAPSLSTGGFSGSLSDADITRICDALMLRIEGTGMNVTKIVGRPILGNGTTVEFYV